MHATLGEPLAVESAATRAYGPRMQNVRAHDAKALTQSPNIGMMSAIGSPNNTSGAIAGNKKTSKGNFELTHTLSTPASSRALTDASKSSREGVVRGARDLWWVFVVPSGISMSVVNSHTCLERTASNWIRDACQARRRSPNLRI